MLQTRRPFAISASPRNDGANAIMSGAVAYRLAVAARATALVAPAFPAWLANSGRGPALDACMVGRGAAFFVSGVQGGATPVRRSGLVPRSLIGAGRRRRFADIVPMAAGRLQLPALHVPRAAAPFGPSAGLSICALERRSVRDAVLSQYLAGDLAYGEWSFASRV